MSRLVLGALFLLAACAPQGQASAVPGPAAAHKGSPTGASVSLEGYATIIDAPPAPFEPAPLTPPAPPSPEQKAAQAQFARAGAFQAAVRDKVQALHARLRAAERGNFVDLYFENEGEPHAVFRFRRNAAETLAKYTRDPRFRAATARFSEEELRQALDYMMETFREDRVILGGGTGNKRNRAVIEIAVTEPEFRALVARKGVTIPDGVELEYHARQPASAINRPLPPDIAPLVRIFPRSDRPIGAVNSIDSQAKIVLRDGCFKVAGGDHDGALVLFPLGAQLFVDEAGYLAYGRQAAPGYARVGETLVFPGSIGRVTAPELTGPIHAACGGGPVIGITDMASAAARQAERMAAQNVQALTMLRESYGLDDATARRVVERCKARQGSGTCLLTPPPPDGSKCPAGTKRSFGLCRTPEGHVRPIPAWIAALIAQ